MPQAMGAARPQQDLVFSYRSGKRNSWIYYGASEKTVFLIDPPSIQPEIVSIINELSAKEHYCIFTREDNSRREHFVQWKQVFHFTLLSHGQRFFDFDIRKKNPHHYSEKGTQGFYQGVELSRGKYKLTHCLIAYKKPYLFSGEILQIGTDSTIHFDQLSRNIKTYLEKLPLDTIILPSVGPVGTLENLLR